MAHHGLVRAQADTLTTDRHTNAINTIVSLTQRNLKESFGCVPGYHCCSAKGLDTLFNSPYFQSFPFTQPIDKSKITRYGQKRPLYDVGPNVYPQKGLRYRAKQQDFYVALRVLRYLTAPVLHGWGSFVLETGILWNISCACSMANENKSNRLPGET